CGTNTLTTPRLDALVLRLDENPAPTPFVERQLALVYEPTGTAYGITLLAHPPAGTSVYAVEDHPPAGWAVSEISQGGVFDTRTGKVKFGPFFDAQARFLDYSVIPPANATGRQCFEGVGSADGVDSPVAGLNCMVPLAEHPADRLAPFFSLAIGEVTAYGAAWRRGEVWTEPPNPIPIDYVTRAAALWRGGEYYQVDPSISHAPLWWVNSQSVMPRATGAAAVIGPAANGAESQLPPVFVPGEPITVTICTVLASNATAYAVEDQFPAGWTVSDISPGGECDATNGKVKWGPFLDGAPRKLTYQVTPPRTTSGPASFAGVGSFDGGSVQITGRRELSEGCRLHVGSQPISGQLEFTFTGRTGASFVVESSSDLITWIPWATFSNTHDGLRFFTRIQPDTPHRFFRARLAK
ncbi:MAG: hypothetical protein NTW03_02080, partial [Verrucomicrobia bacterium]|nr:hypothetical protein [Verrucomicrobiota bacterium]